MPVGTADRVARSCSHSVFLTMWCPAATRPQMQFTTQLLVGDAQQDTHRAEHVTVCNNLWERELERGQGCIDKGTLGLG